MTWAGFAGVFALFFATHSIPVQPFVKARVVERFGARGFRIGYSLLSFVMLALLIRAAGMAPFVELWPQMNWQLRVVHVGMLVVCLILAFSLARPNPFSFGGAQNDRFDPAHPGIVHVIRHPILVALSLWAGLHLLPNGDLAHVLLFGVLGAFAVGGRTLINRRKRHEMGFEQWDQLNAAVSQAPVLPVPLSWLGAVVRVAVGLGLFAALLTLHPIVIGVAAL